MFGGIRVEVVPDDDVQAHPDIPKDVLEKLDQESVLMGLRMMYVRASHWERLKKMFDRLPERKAPMWPGA